MFVTCSVSKFKVTVMKFCAASREPSAILNYLKLGVRLITLPPLHLFLQHMVGCSCSLDDFQDAVVFVMTKTLWNVFPLPFCFDYLRLAHLC